MKNIYLIGMMGCGKTTCAGLLSQALGVPMVDTDAEIERIAGMSVSEIFSRYGEEHFRGMETDLCRTLASQEDRIVACGGGLPLRAENRKLLRESGTVIFLNRNAETIYDSVDMAGRPLGQQGKAAFLTRFAGRRPLYEAAAHLIIEDHPTAEEAVGEILRQLEESA